MKAINSIKLKTNKPTAFGLHCTNHNILYSAISFEPEAIFFYVKDQTNGEHPDDKHAISINHVEQTVLNLRQLKTSLGDGKKISTENTLHPVDDNIMSRKQS